MSASQTIKPITGLADGWEIAFNTPYAAAQHENLEYFHPSKRRGGTGPRAPGQAQGPKYLEFAADQQLPLIPAEVAAKIQKLIRGL